MVETRRRGRLDVRASWGAACCAPTKAVGITLGALLWIASPGAALGLQNPARSSQGSTRTEKIVNPLNGLLDEAQRDIDQKNFAAAIEPLQKVIADEPDIAFPHFQLGYVFTALQRGDEARAEYERVIAIDPKMSAAYLYFGILLLDKDAAAAVAPLKKVVELPPSESRPRLLLGVAQERSE